MITPAGIVAVLAAAAACLVGFGLPRARRFRHPGRFRAGVVASALGLIGLWLFPALAAVIVDDSLLRVAAMLGALFVAVSLLGGGITAMSRANNTPREDMHHPFWDNLP